MKVEELERKWRQFSGKGGKKSPAAGKKKTQDIQSNQNNQNNPPGKSPGETGKKKK
jgi:hypothetical protein